MTTDHLNDTSNNQEVHETGFKANQIRPPTGTKRVCSVLGLMVAKTLDRCGTHLKSPLSVPHSLPFPADLQDKQRVESPGPSGSAGVPRL